MAIHQIAQNRVGSGSVFSERSSLDALNTLAVALTASSVLSLIS